MIRTPWAFARGTVQREGARGEQWLADLPAVVARMMERWHCVPDGEVMHGGVALVVPVLRPATGPAVLKVSFPHPGNRHEPDALAAWDGHGAVRLLERDDAEFAMLLERTDPTTLAQVTSTDEVAAVAGRVSRRLAVPAPPGLPRLRAQADAWQEQLRRDSAEFPHVLPHTVVARAMASVRELAHGQPDVLIHGDMNARNILKATREPWLAADPKGWAGDPAYDCGTLVKSRSVALLGQGDLRTSLHRLIDVFTEAAGLDRRRARHWAQLQAVQAAFSGRRRGFRRAREGEELRRLVSLADELATLLTTPA
ncbi:aminoglycoside phosphotransferase family protein [Streptomyces sp. NPDC048664]|uniref:aminoglycoside phosphotransferase family protein n=1 Tax=Streptomyces sp. NPDC048664 TaxID=3154505 RepID=UPI00343AAF93